MAALDIFIQNNGKAKTPICLIDRAVPGEWMQPNPQELIETAMTCIRPFVYRFLSWQFCLPGGRMEGIDMKNNAEEQ